MSSNGRTRTRLIDPRRIPGTADGRQKLADEIVRNMMANNAYSLRGLWRALGDPRRNIEDEIGTPQWDTPLEAAQLRMIYDRHPIGARVIEVFPRQMWMVSPLVYETERGEETEFERRFDEVCAGLRGSGGRTWFRPREEEGNPLWAACMRWDIMAGIGGYGALLLGIDDGRPLDQPAAGVVEEGSVPGAVEKGEDGKPVVPEQSAKPYRLVGNDVGDGGGRYRNLRYVREFSEDQATVTRWETNRWSPRYMQPCEYMLTLADPRTPTNMLGSAQPFAQQRCHWTRVVHLADNHHQPGGNPFVAPPRIRPVYDVLEGLHKVYGASPEGYWKMCFTNLSFETLPELGPDVEVDETKMRDLQERVQNGLQKAWTLTGMTAKPIAPTVNDPSPHVNAGIEAVCIKINCPVRIFKGSERGELSSAQDKGGWNDTLRERERNYGTPNCVVPVVDRLILLGICPQPSGYYVQWPDRDALSANEKADVLLKRTQAWTTYASGGMAAVVPERDYATRFDSMKPEEVDAMLAATEAGDSSELGGSEPLPEPKSQLPDEAGTDEQRRDADVQPVAAALAANSETFASILREMIGG